MSAAFDGPHAEDNTRAHDDSRAAMSREGMAENIPEPCRAACSCAVCVSASACLRLPSLDVECRVSAELMPRVIVLESAEEMDCPVCGKPARAVIAVRIGIDLEEEC